MDKINTWKRKTLSIARKEVLIKFVVKAIHVYSMSIYPYPPFLCDEVQWMLNSYWWRSFSRDSKGIMLLAWDKLTVPKEVGGLGFRELHVFNLAILGKQGWNFISNLSIMISRIFKAKYYPNGKFLDVVVGYNLSYC